MQNNKVIQSETNQTNTSFRFVHFSHSASPLALFISTIWISQLICENKTRCRYFRTCASWTVYLLLHGVAGDCPGESVVTDLQVPGRSRGAELGDDDLHLSHGPQASALLVHGHSEMVLCAGLPTRDRGQELGSVQVGASRYQQSLRHSVPTQLSIFLRFSHQSQPPAPLSTPKHRKQPELSVFDMSDQT